MSDNKLKFKRCPFCGKRKFIHVQYEPFGYWARVVCDYCGLSSTWHQVEGYQDTEAAVQLWNMRPKDKQLIKRLRRHKK